MSVWVRLKWFIITRVPFLLDRYLDTLRWRLDDDERNIVFNKPIPPLMIGTFAYGRTVEHGHTTHMNFYLYGKLIQKEIE